MWRPGTPPGSTGGARGPASADDAEQAEKAEPSSGRGRPAAPGGGRFIPEVRGKASTEVYDNTGIGQHTGEFGRKKS